MRKAWVLATPKEAFSLFMLVFSNLLYMMRRVQRRVYHRLSDFLEGCYYGY